MEPKKRRSTIKSKSTRLFNIVTKLKQNNDFDECMLDIYMEQVNDLWRELNVVHDEIMNACDEKSEQQHEAVYDDIANNIDSIKISIAKLRSSPSLTKEPKFENSTVNLPKIDMPVFSGNYLDWISFRGLFKASVHANPSLSNAQKLQYLKLSLKNEAAVLLHAMQISDSNYEKAWSILTDRYENESKITFATLEKLFSQPNLNHESATGLRRLLDTTTMCLDTLQILKQPVDQWDTILIYFLQKKLDSESFRQWMLTHSSRKIQTFNEFREFIDQRARALEDLNVTKVTLPYRTKAFENLKTNKQSLSHHAISNLCLCCKGSHSIYKCERFVKLSDLGKNDLVFKNRLCRNCLRPGHFRSTCSSSGCKTCNKAHHTLLHVDKNEVNSSTKQELCRIQLQTHIRNAVEI